MYTVCTPSSVLERHTRKKTYSSNSCVKILKKICVKTPRRTAGNLNATVSVIKSKTLCIQNYRILGLFDVRLQFDGIKDDALTYISFTWEWWGREVAGRGGARNKEGGSGTFPVPPTPGPNPHSGTEGSSEREGRASGYHRRGGGNDWRKRED